MTANLRRLNDIAKEVKVSVSGYIRENQYLFQSEDHGIFNNIPQLIPSLCILYTDPGDRFEIIGDGIAYVNGDKTTIVKPKTFKGPRSSTCYGSEHIQSNKKSITKWDLKIVNIPSKCGVTAIKIGVASAVLSSNSKPKNILGDRYYINSNVGWVKTHSGTVLPKTHSKYQTGDVMTITLDLTKKKVLFYNHRSKDEVCIDMTDFEGYSYRLAVAVRVPEVSVCIDKFTQELFD